MTSERDKFEGDERVTEAYRELGAEKAPESLNQAILEMAAGGSKRSGARDKLLGAWMKPLAWAATIGLSLAIVLEVTQVPTAAVRYDAVPRAESVLEEIVLQDTDKLQTIEHRVLEQPGASRSAITKDEVADDVEVFRRESKGKMDFVAAPVQMPSSPAPTPVSVDQMPGDPQDTARKRAADSLTLNEPMASFAVMAEEKEADTAESCDARIRLSAEDWLECIDNLRQSGALEAADREYEALILEYPNESENMEPNK
jgi:hypothetical protein